MTESAAIDLLITLFDRVSAAIATAVGTTVSTPAAVAFVALSLTSTLVMAALLRRPTRLRVALAWTVVSWPVVLLASLGGVGGPLIATVAFDLVAIAAGFGVAASARLPETSALERVVIAPAIGLGVIGLVALGLGELRALNAIALTIAAVLLLVGCVYLIRRRGSTLTRAPRATATTSYLMLAIYVLIVCLVSVTAIYVVSPEVNYDSVYYHLTLAREFSARGGTPTLPELWTSNVPILPELLYSVVTIFSNLDAGKILHFTVGLATALSIGAVAARLAGPLAAALAVLTWLASPLVLWEMSSAYNDLFLALWSSTAVLAALLWTQTRRRTYALLCGAFLGFGFGVKVSMVLVAIPLALTLLIFSIRRKSDLTTWLLSAVVTVLVAAPWYVRSYLLTGNPIFPLYNAVFRSPLWEIENASFNFAGFGMGHGLIDLVLLPWRLTVNTSRFVEAPNGSLGLLPLLIGGAAIVALVRRDRQVLPLGAVVVVGTIMWSVLIDYARYALPVLALGASFTAACLAWTLGANQWPLRIAARLGILFVGLLALPGLIGMMWNVPGGVPWRVDLGLADRPSYLRDALRHYRAYEWIETNLPDAATARFLGVGLSEWPIVYGPPHIFIAHQTFDGKRVLAAREENEVIDALETHQFRYVILDEFPRPNPGKVAWTVAHDTFLASQLRLIYANSYVYVYAVSPPRFGSGDELLSDNRFDVYRESAIASPWLPFGIPGTVTTGCSGIQVTDSTGLLQHFEAVGNELYSVEMTIASRSSNAYGKLQVGWNVPNSTSAIEIEINPVTNQPSTYHMASTTPSGATAGTIIVSGYGAEPVCVTSASIVRGARSP